MVTSNDTPIGAHLRLRVRDGLGAHVDPRTVADPAVELDAEIEPHEALVATHFVAPAAALAEVATAVGEPEELFVDGAFVTVDGPDAEAVRVLRAAGAYDNHICDVLAARDALGALGFGVEATEIAARCGLVAAIPDDVTQAGTAVLFRTAVASLLETRAERRSAVLREQLTELDADAELDPTDCLDSARAAEQEVAAARAARFGPADAAEQQQLLGQLSELRALRDEAAVLLDEVSARHSLARERLAGPRAGERDALTLRRDQEAGAVARLTRPAKFSSFGARRRQRAAQEHEARLADAEAALAAFDAELDRGAGATLRAVNTARRRLDALDAECATVESRLDELDGRARAADAAEAAVRARWADRITGDADAWRSELEARRAQLRAELERIDQCAADAAVALEALIAGDVSTI